MDNTGKKIKVRITPVLKAMGFRYDKTMELYRKDMTHVARVYKKGETERQIEMWEATYNGRGEFTGNRLVLKNFSLDADVDKYSLYKQVFENLREEFDTDVLIEELEYFLGLSQERKIPLLQGGMSLRTIDYVKCMQRMNVSNQLVF